MGLMYTLVSTCVCLLSSWVPEIGSMSLLSISMVNLRKEWHWFKISRELTADVLSGMIVSESSTYLLYATRETMTSRNGLGLWKY